MANEDKAAADKATAEKAAADKAAAEKAAAAKQKTVTLRHKTQYSVYRRAGIILSAQPKEYAVTAAQLAALKADVWVEVTEK